MDEPVVRRWGRVRWGSRRLKQRGTQALVMMAAVVLLELATASKVAQAQARELATVKSAELHVYSQMDTTGKVIHTLLRGDLVEIDHGVTPAQGAWCSITEIGGSGTSGYVRCTKLERRAAGSSKPLRFIEKPPPKLMAKTTEPEVTQDGRYTLQVASLVLKRNALALKTRLERLGFHPIVRLTTTPISRHQVYGGQFSSRKEAEMFAERLSRDGFPAKLVELDDGRVGLEVESYFTLNEAIDLAHRLQEQDYTPKIVSRAVPTPVHQVRVGRYHSRADALEALEQLKREGLTPIIVRQ